MCRGKRNADAPRPISRCRPRTRPCAGAGRPEPTRPARPAGPPPVPPAAPPPPTALPAAARCHQGHCRRPPCPTPDS
ncbi:hypothetical protein EJ903_21325 [Azospirillum griseum]|uniref:Uncharacterized protein n=1 Tax=Azospirillum griseum TaxID=2496639 RepID=A0A3S0K891_9PROT|nr:hypothetical protein EJ903_21325 [Azospirillum griseum]